MLKMIRPNQDIINLIFFHLLNDNINLSYNFFITNYHEKYNSREDGFFLTNKSNLLIKGLNISGLVGIDLPSLFENHNQNNGRKLMIIGQDPLRNSKDFPNDKQIIVGTPFALHSTHYTKNGWGKFYENLVKMSLNKYQYVYLTDNSKIWTENKNKNINSNSLTLLKEEIRIEKPDTILILGKKAQTTLNQLSISSSIKIVKIPHPNARPNTWKANGLNETTHKNISNFIIKQI